MASQPGTDRLRIPTLFRHLSGACNFFKGDKTFRLNGKPWTVPETGFYTTVADVDYALKFLDEARSTGNLVPVRCFQRAHAPFTPPQDCKIQR